jgi:hypothetical protein
MFILSVRKKLYAHTQPVLKNVKHTLSEKVLLSNSMHLKM